MMFRLLFLRLFMKIPSVLGKNWGKFQVCLVVFGLFCIYHLFQIMRVIEISEKEFELI